MTSPPQSLTITLSTLALLASCTTGKPCAPPYHRHEVFLYATPETNYLFFKNNPSPIGYFVTSDLVFYQNIRDVYYSGIRRNIGVKAAVCGRIMENDLPLRDFDQSMWVKAGEVLHPVDMTAMIERYQRQFPVPPLDARQSVRRE
jgi:hypothetical protein